MNLTVNIEDKKSQADKVFRIAILFLPFFVLYWLVPFFSRYTIGNDYVSYWIRQQLYLHFSIRNGTFPLYAPGFVGGWTSSALTLGQLWYPISWIASLVPGYWSGHAHEIGTMVRLFSLGLTHLVIFSFLRRLRLGIVLAFIFSFITVYNLRALDMFRYGAALENYTAFLMLCVAIGWYCVSPTKRLGPVCIILCSWLLVTGGHPQMMYLGLLGAGVIGFIMPFYIRTVLPEKSEKSSLSLPGYYLSVCVCVMCGILLSSLHLLPYYFEYLPDTWRTGGLDFSWACGHQDSVSGSICNFFNPFHSDVHGAFGGSSLILAAVFVPVLYIFRARVPRPVLSLWLLFVVVFFMTLGSNGFLYYYFWKYFPFAQDFRVPGRMGIYIPFLFLLIFIWVIRCRPIVFRIRSRRIKLYPLAIVTFAGMVAFITLHCLPFEMFKLQKYTPAKLNNLTAKTTIFAMATGIIGLLALIIYTIQRRFRLIISVILVLAVVLQVGVTLRWGTWIVRGPVVTKTFEQMQQEQRKQMSFKYSEGLEGSRSLLKHFEHTFLEPGMARICPKYTNVNSQEEAYKGITLKHAIGHVYVENCAIERLAADEKGVSKVKLIYNSFNNLKFDVESSVPAFFVFSLPSDNWRGYVNGRRSDVYRANGIEHAVWIEQGRNEVEFRYWSWPALTGAAISCVTLFLVLVYLSLGMRNLSFRLSVVLASGFLCVALYFIWYQSLYCGGNISTRYEWTSDSIGRHLSSDYNLAYGKTTAMSASLLCPYTSVSSRGVDGDRNSGFGFVTARQNGAWWLIDIGRVEQVAEIILYKHLDKKIRCSLPFYIIVSSDGKDWHLLKTINSNGRTNHWRISLNNHKLRYIRLQASGIGRLALSEVEVYGPDGVGKED